MVASFFYFSLSKKTLFIYSICLRNITGNLLLGLCFVFFLMSGGEVKGQTEIFRETVGTCCGSTNTSIVGTTFDNTDLTFTGTADTRTSTGSSGYSGASGGRNIFFTNDGTSSFQIEGINTSDYIDLKLAFGAFKSTTASDMTELVVEWSSDGTNYIMISFPAQPTGSGTSNWRLIEEIVLPIEAQTENLRLRWRQTSTTPQFRIDDITLEGILSVLPCTQPTTQPTAFNEVNTTSTTSEISWTRGNGDRVIVVAREGSAVNAIPQFDETYTANATFGSGDEIGTGNFVVYNGTGTSVEVTNLKIGTSYHFSILEYNNPNTCYFIPALTGSITTIAGLQLDATDTRYLIDFDNTVSGVSEGAFAGSGFSPTPSSGQLNSNALATTGMSDGNSGFGANQITENTDFTRGTSNGGVTTGGFYAFDVGSGNRAFGVQPGGSDWAPGTVTLRVQNQTASSVDSLLIGYTVYVYNDQGRSNSFNFSYSADNSTYTPVSAIDFVSDVVADVSPEWKAFHRVALITGITINASDFAYLRWSGTDDGGGGSRDEFALDDIQIVAKPQSVFPQFSGTARELVLAGSAVLDGDLTIDSLLKVADGGELNTVAHKVVLGSAALLSETDDFTVVGMVETQRPAPASESTSFGGIGFSVTPALDMGETTVTRITGARLRGGPTEATENESLLRYFQVEPTNNANLDATIVFSYAAKELVDTGGDPVSADDLLLFKRDIGAGNDEWVLLTGADIDGGSRTITVTGIDSFSEIALADANAPLPVELLSFTAGVTAEGKVQLQWVTASEKDNAGFEIQKSADGVNFDVLGWVEGHGTTNAQQDYTFTDRWVSADLNTYYRLKQVDYDGAFEYSPLVFVVRGEQSFKVELFPVPAAHSVTLRSTAPIAAVALYNTLGVRVALPVTQKENNQLTLDVQRLPLGMYILQVRNAQGGVERVKLVKSH